MAVEVLHMMYLFNPHGMAEYDFRVNLLHDLESIWWIGMWFLTRNCPKDSQHTTDHAGCHTQLFGGSDDRVRFLLTSIAEHFVPKFPELFRSAGDALIVILRSLRDAYETAEAFLAEFDPTPYEDDKLPRLFFDELSRYVEGAPDVSFDQPSPSSQPKTKSRIRQRASDDEPDNSPPPRRISKKLRMGSNVQSSEPATTTRTGSPIRRSERLRKPSASGEWFQSSIEHFIDSQVQLRSFETAVHPQISLFKTCGISTSSKGLPMVGGFDGLLWRSDIYILRYYRVSMFR
jgi:hypothetical protein